MISRLSPVADIELRRARRALPSIFSRVKDVALPPLMPSAAPIPPLTELRRSVTDFDDAASPGRWKELSTLNRLEVGP